MQAKDQNDNYICQKHNQPISLVVMDNGFKPVDQILCLQCMSLIRCPLNCVLGVNQAKEMIKEKLTNRFAEQKNTIKQQLGQLQTIHQDLIELRQRILKSIDTIDGVLSQWMNDLNSIQNDDLIDLIKGLEKLQMNHEEFSNLIEQNNQTFSTKLDSAFQILLKNEGFKDWHSKIIQLNFFFEKKGKEFNTNTIKLTNQVLPITQQNFKQNALPQPLSLFSQLNPFNLQNLSQNQLHNPNSVSQNNTNQRSNLNITPFKQIQSPVFPEANPHNKPPFFQVKQNEQQQQIQAQLNARLQRIKINLKKVDRKSILYIPYFRRANIETYNKIIFNNNGQILLAVKGKQIDLYSFDQQNLNLQTEIKGQANISCLKFSTTNQFFISGDESGQIQFWKQGENIKQWFFKNAEKKNLNKISFLFLTQNEKELISCNDKFIVFWKVKQEENPIEYKHHLVNQGQVQTITINESETSLIASDGYLICLWQQNQSAQWSMFSKINISGESDGFVTLFFMNENQFFASQGQNKTNSIVDLFVYEIKNQQIIKLQNTLIKTEDKQNIYGSQGKNTIFSPVYCKSKHILLYQSSSCFYLMQNPFLEQCNVDELKIQMCGSCDVGTMTKDGDYLILTCFEESGFFDTIKWYDYCFYIFKISNEP